MAKTRTQELNEGRFMRRLAYRTSDEDCWIWAGSTFKRKRTDGSVRKIPVMPFKTEEGGNTITYARRFAWIMKYGFIYPEDSHVVNICGEELCVKPDPKHNRPTNPGDAYYERRQHEATGTVKAVTEPKNDDEFLKQFK